MVYCLLSWQFGREEIIMPQKIGTLRLALTFAGCFLGAGYVSGQELWQYFGAFGARGLLGVVMIRLCFQPRLHRYSL